MAIACPHFRGNFDDGKASARCHCKMFKVAYPYFANAGMCQMNRLTPLSLSGHCGKPGQEPHSNDRIQDFIMSKKRLIFATAAWCAHPGSSLLFGVVAHRTGFATHLGTGVKTMKGL